MNIKLVEATLFVATVFSGFYAGTGFFVCMGGNPAIKLMSGHTFAEYWQHTDYFMAARMKIFGPLLLLLAVTATVTLFKEWRTLSFWFMLAATLILMVDAVFVFHFNMPLNQLIQSWDIAHLPDNVMEIKSRVVQAFSVRVWFMISSFLLVLLALWCHKKSW